MKDQKDHLQRLCVLLAGSGLTENQLRDALRWIREDPEVVSMKILQIKRAIAGQLDLYKDVEEPAESPNSRTRSTPKALASMVEQLLVREANLSDPAASRALWTELPVELARGLKPVSQTDARSFRQWVAALARKASPSLILHHASVIRNRMVHQPHADWPLRSRE